MKFELIRKTNIIHLALLIWSSIVSINEMFIITMKVLLEDWLLIHIIELIYSVFENKEKDCSIFMLLFVNWSFLDPKYPVLKFAVPSWTLHNIDKNIPIQHAFNVHVHTSNVKQILIHDKNTFASFSQVYLLCIIIHVAF